jgi:hypothetical protein
MSLLPKVKKNKRDIKSTQPLAIIIGDDNI